MGTVFVFLTALVIAMTLMSKVINHFQSRSSPSGATEEEVAAIGAAISRHRSQ
jgi:sodium pump decarboxylase gamma subunit